MRNMQEVEEERGKENLESGQGILFLEIKTTKPDERYESKKREGLGGYGVVVGVSGLTNADIFSCYSSAVCSAKKLPCCFFFAWLAMKADTHSTPTSPG